ncbi:FLYWCH zinc finger domain [Popillia japonica]|uniref:FLYWCH zinc finger domain n=1 Tax=Popillia japonica TaxID=7064 RepID=A0AAW1MNW6_POPJA
MFKWLSSGLLFYKKRQTDEKISWRCEHFQKFKCSARVTTVGDKIVKVGKDHNHVGDAAQVEAAKIYDSIRTSAKTTNDTPQNIISEVTLGCSQAAAPKLPRIDTMKRSIRRIRQQQMSGPALPNHLVKKLNFKKNSRKLSMEKIFFSMIPALRPVF